MECTKTKRSIDFYPFSFRNWHFHSSFLIFRRPPTLCAYAPIRSPLTVCSPPFNGSELRWMLRAVTLSCSELAGLESEIASLREVTSKTTFYSVQNGRDLLLQSLSKTKITFLTLLRGGSTTRSPNATNCCLPSEGPGQPPFGAPACQLGMGRARAAQAQHHPLSRQRTEADAF